MKKSIVVLAVVLTIAVTAVSVIPAVYAGSKWKCEKKGQQTDLGNMVLMKAAMICKNKSDLGLSDEQVEQIKVLKTNTKKNLIKAQAEIDIVEIDLQAEIRKDTIDTEAVNKLIDKKYELKKEKAKSAIASYAKLKSILTADQQKQLKALYKECKRGKVHKENKRHK